MHEVVVVSVYVKTQLNKQQTIVILSISQAHSQAFSCETQHFYVLHHGYLDSVRGFK